MNALDRDLALFIMLGQTGGKVLAAEPDVASRESLLVTPGYDLAEVLPGEVNRSDRVSVAYRLFYVFENYLRSVVKSVLSEDDPANWWERVPKNVQDDVKKLEETEEAKAWMNIGTRDRLSLTTYPQLLQIISDNWKDYFEEIVRDKYLVEDARHIGHLRNAICHMSDLPPEEIDRIRQVIRDWFRVVAP